MFSLRMIISVLVLATFSPTKSFSNVKAQYSVVISKPFLATQLLRGLGDEFTFNKTVENFLWQGPLPLLVQSAKISFATSPKDIGFTKSDEITASFSGLKFDLFISDLSVDTVVRQRVGDMDVNLRVKAACQNIHLSYDDEAALLASDLRLTHDGNGLVIKTQNTRLKLDGSQWAIGDISCQGINGIEKFVLDQIRQTLMGNPAQLEKVVANFLDVEGGAVLNRQISSGMSSLGDLGKVYKLSTTTRLISVKQTAEHLNMKLETDVLTSDTGTFTIADANEADIKTLSIQLPKGFSEFLVHQSINGQFAGTTLSSKDFPSLDSLTNSRFLQLFFWPGLMVLPVGVELQVKPVLQKTVLEFKQVSNDKLAASLSGYAGFWISHDIPMVYLGSPFGASAILSAKGIEKVRLSNLRLYNEWSKEFVEKYNPSKRMATSFFTTQLQDFLKEKIQTVRWPQLNFGKETLSVQSLQVRDAILEIQY